jgi:hypothetical protein
MIILTIAALFTAQAIFAQTDQKVSAIRTEVNKIARNAKVYTKKTKTYESEGSFTTATYFLSGGEIKKITASVESEGFSETYELFYSGGVLIFALNTEFHMDPAFAPNMPGSGPGKVAKVVQKRLYFNEGQMIRYLVGKKAMRTGGEEWETAQKSTLNEADDLRQEMPLSE